MLKRLLPSLLFFVVFVEATAASHLPPISKETTSNIEMLKSQSHRDVAPSNSYESREMAFDGLEQSDEEEFEMFSPVEISVFLRDLLLTPFKNGQDLVLPRRCRPPRI